jgi:hypothetical protein
VFFYIFFLTISLAAQEALITPPYKLFLHYEKLALLNNEDSVEKIFRSFESIGLITKKEISQAIYFETQNIFLKMKKTRKEDPEFQTILDYRSGLQRFRKHIKKHRHLYEFLSYSHLLEKRYAYAFGNKYVVEDVYQHPDRYDYSTKKGDRLVKFLKLLLLDLERVDRFETKLHSNYGRLKAWNYSFKIECIKLRNEILLHPWYKYRLRPGYEFFADCVSPLSYMGKAIFHVLPSIFCLSYFLISTDLSGPSSR